MGMGNIAAAFFYFLGELSRNHPFVWEALLTNIFQSRGLEDFLLVLGGSRTILVEPKKALRSASISPPQPCCLFHPAVHSAKSLGFISLLSPQALSHCFKKWKPFFFFNLENFNHTKSRG